MVEPLPPNLSIFCRLWWQIFRNAKSFGRHISTRRLTQDKERERWSTGREHGFKEEHSCQAQREEIIPVKKTSENGPASTEYQKSQAGGKVMLTH